MHMGNLLFLAALATLSTWSSASADVTQAALVPVPAQYQAQLGEFVWSPQTRLVVSPADPEVRRVARTLYAELFGVPQADATETPPARGFVLFTTDAADPSLGDEGYSLDVTPDGVTVRAPKPAGLFYAGQTLRQMLVEKDGRKTIPCARIADSPRFVWRGLMLDCSRTFLTMDYLRRYVDLLARHKLNVLHLHLTDDQGWRIEIRKHPKLTEVGAQFDPRLKGEVSGYYTQQELRDLVRYAAERFVEVVPEIEMPSHCVAALTAYPDLSCRGDAYAIVPHQYKKHPTSEMPVPPYGVFCAGNERTFSVLEDVLSEVIEVFPSRYVHIGGDECPKEYWKGCPKCQARMKENGLKDEDELQSYFVKRIETYLNDHGRTLVGWDEILEGGLAPNATVMSWRGIDGGIKAASAGHDVVMSPTTYCYLDYNYIRLPLEQTYAFDPVPAALSPEQGRHILGVQGNMWTHLARTELAIDAQIFPRLVAIAEAGWSPQDRRNLADFERRMETHYRRLDAYGVNYYRE